MCHKIIKSFIPAYSMRQNICSGSLKISKNCNACKVKKKKYRQTAKSISPNTSRNCFKFSRSKSFLQLNLIPRISKCRYRNIKNPEPDENPCFRIKSPETTVKRNIESFPMLNCNFPNTDKTFRNIINNNTKCKNI